MTSGYSGKPLATKMGIKPGQRIIILHAPDGYDSTLGILADGADRESKVDHMICQADEAHLVPT